jgi:hypothetical protein
LSKRRRRLVSDIRAIETRYKGYRFRSRLEARWAVFFDAVGLRFEYEKEGFHLPSGRLYLPDFWLPSLGCWAEIKPTPDPWEGQPWMAGGSLEEEFFGCKENGGAEQPGFVIYGTPGEPVEYHKETPYACAVFGDSPYLFCLCPWCGKVGVEFDGRGARVCGWQAHFGTEGEAFNGFKYGTGHWRVDDKCYTAHEPRLLLAFETARSARFEHGESPR